MLIQDRLKALGDFKIPENAAELESKHSCMAGKPTVFLERAILISKEDGEDFLVGYPVNHPNQGLNGKLIRSSKVITPKTNNARYLNILETKNTVYNVVSWNFDKSTLRNHL